ncbi:hypothetical protein IFU25_07965 [Pantoea agglomerans]|uniref:hypothetical protein n=1 Tax=Enterobacter agglomerans TaxID=549 RepID=UPI00177ABDCB|nr:hypothetical protein [Pantoea agglomerans]MBD8181636.1 hypothetical protein [Pantoea agglomerans]
MTEEQKQALIEHIETDLELLRNVTLKHCHEVERECVLRDIEANEIALAALTTPEYWKQRAEAAEAKLAELAKQEPVAYWHHSGQVVTREECHDEKIFAICCKVERPLFTRPAPAADLAELVPDPAQNKYWDNLGYGTRFKVRDYHNDVVAILRKIEETK